MKRKALFAGTFYPSDKNELNDLIKNFEQDNIKYFSRAVIVPHAGYKYSGKLTSSGIQHLKKDLKNIFIFAPAHFERIFGCIICNYNSFETPLGEVEVNKNLSEEIAKFCDCNVNNHAFENEHSIEVLLPFIKTYLPDTKIIPILYGCENFKNLAETIEHFYANSENGFIISSDLSHFYPEKEAYKIDNYTAKMIEENKTADFEIEQACGAVGICGLTDFAKKNNFSLIRNGLTNSAAANGDSSRVVGYGSWLLYEGEKNQYIKNFCSDIVIKICKDSILSGLQLGQTEIENYDCVLEEFGASFVTIELDGILRGCVGSTTAYRPLIDDLRKNAHAAAFSDSRFPPLSINEYNKIEIKVSLLSKPERTTVDEITPFKDGVIIRDGLHKAVFLPEVWKQLSDKKEFLNQLLKKAGLNNFTEDTEIFKFKTTKI